MSRRAQKQNDSLELLLDTICNTFGGIVFIAILVVILLQLSRSKSERRPAGHADPIVLKKLQNDLSVLNSMTSRARASASSQRKLLGQFAPEEVRAQLRMRQQLVENAATLADERNRSLLENSRQAQTIESLRKEIETTREQLKVAAKRVSDLKSRIVREREQRTEQSRMPIVHSAGQKREVGVILRYGRMYVWHKYDRFGSRLGLNIDEFAVVGERDGMLITTPIPTAGVILDGTPDSKQSVQRRLQQFQPDRSYIVAVVRPDSFREFRFLRDLLIEMDFEYRLMPLEEGSPVADRGGSGGNVQ